jgi:hypothetical protein
LIHFSQIASEGTLFAEFAEEGGIGRGKSGVDGLIGVADADEVEGVVGVRRMSSQDFQ